MIRPIALLVSLILPLTLAISVFPAPTIINQQSSSYSSDLISTFRVNDDIYTASFLQETGREKGQSSFFLQQLPHGPLEEIAAYLSTKDHIALRRTAKDLRMEIKPRVWELLAKWVQKNGLANSLMLQQFRSTQYDSYRFCMYEFPETVTYYPKIDDCLNDVDMEYPNPNVASTDGKTALAIAVSTSRIDIARELLKRGSNPNTAIGMAAKNGNIEMLHLLFNHQQNFLVDPNIRNDDGETPLMEAAKSSKFSVGPNEYAECAKLLIQYGAKLGFTNKRGKSALSIASSTGNRAMVRLLQSPEAFV